MNSEFKNKVYELLRTVPVGFVVTYGQLAEMAGNKYAARSVGVFMRNNPDAPNTPCHRVVASDGSLTGYSGEGGVQTKRLMLINEGVSFRGDKVNLRASQWRPA